MEAVLDQPEVEQYDCACAGFRTSNLMLMCLRCLDAYSEALPLVVKDPARLQFEMQRVAKRLAVLLKNDPLVANLPVEAALNAAA